MFDTVSCRLMLPKSMPLFHDARGVHCCPLPKPMREAQEPPRQSSPDAAQESRCTRRRTHRRKRPLACRIPALAAYWYVPGSVRAYPGRGFVFKGVQDLSRIAVALRAANGTVICRRHGCFRAHARGRGRASYRRATAAAAKAVLRRPSLMKRVIEAAVCDASGSTSTNRR